MNSGLIARSTFSALTVYTLVNCQFVFATPRCEDLFRNISFHRPIHGPRFSQNQLSEIGRGARQLIEKTTNSDTVIFLGRSPIWFGQAFRYLAPERKALYVAFSGRPYSDQYSIPTPNQIVAFRKYLGRTGLDIEDVMRNTNGRLVIVDNSQSGKGINGFTQLIKDWAVDLGYDQYAIPHKFLFLNLTHQTGSVPRITIRHENILIDRDTIIPLANAKDGEIMGTHYPYWKWDIVDPAQETPTDDALQLRSQLMNWLSQNH